MNKTKQKRLEAKGWRVGDAADFLELSPEEAALIEEKLTKMRHPQQKVRRTRKPKR